MEIAKKAAAIVVALTLGACAPGSVSRPSPPPSESWTTYHGDAARDGHPPGVTLDSAASRRLQPLWRARLDGAVDGTPAVADGMAVAASMGGDVAAFELANGRPVWKRGGLGPISASPAVDAGIVLVATLDGHVRALALKDGASLWDWKAPGDHPALWSSPAVTGRTVVIGSGSPFGDTPFEPGRMFGLDATTGRLVWGECMRPQCALGDGVWSTPSFDPSDTGFVGVGNPGDGVRAFDPSTGAVEWEVSLYADGGRDLDIGASPVVVHYQGREALAISSVSGLMALLDARDGTIIWSRQVISGGEVHGLLATPAFDGARLYAVSASPPTGALAIGLDGAMAWSHATDLPAYSAPVAGRGVLVFGTGNVFGDVGSGTLTVLSAGDGAQLYSFDTGSAVRSSPAVVGRLVLAGDAAGDVIALSPRS